MSRDHSHSEDPSRATGIELVVARHEEDLRWLRRVPAGIRIAIYNKGRHPRFPKIFLTGSL